MMGNVMHRGKGSFTHVENTVFFDHGLSLKAKGIYCQIRSLESNPDWVFTTRGFSTLVRDGVDAVTASIKELEEAGYIIRARKRSENGRFLKAEEATWITLDDSAMHAEVADEPIPQDMLDADGGPLDMAGLAQADPEFAKLWRRVETRRSVPAGNARGQGRRPADNRLRTRSRSLHTGNLRRRLG